MKPIEMIATFLFFYIILSIIPDDSDNIKTIKYCKIDSVYTPTRNEIVPDITLKYHTECDITFTSKKQYSIGDSIEVKTIIIQ